MKKNQKVESIINNVETSKSQKMKDLYDLKLTIKDISTLLNVRYNFVYNVISNYCNVNEITLTTVKNTESKKEKILELFKLGKSNKEISIELRTNYNYVYNTIKKFKLDNEKNVN